MDVFVLDTASVTEARLRRMLGAKDLEESLARLSELIREARLKLNARFYMTPLTWSELRRVLIGNSVRVAVIQEFAAWLTVKAPDKLSLQVPASVFSEYVADVKRRLYKGLRVAEAATVKAARECPDEEELGAAVRELREKYREATRKGLVDSVEDLDTILLAMELKGIVVTSDAGMKRLAEQLGIIVVDSEDFVNMLRRMISSVDSQGPRE